MKQRALLLALLFSATVNIVLVATLTARLLVPSRREEPPPRPFCDGLALSAHQAQAIDSTRHCFATEVGGVCLALHKERQRLVDLLAAEEPDTQAIAACMDRIDSLQSILQRRAVAAIMHERQILTPEQASAYFAMIRARLNVDVPCQRLAGAGGQGGEDCPVAGSECPNQRR
ncbi:MAG: periplasmic heavy metal sensor [bacterium]|jgi:Spy/CpxP family protein refolding chaperone|nr:periplasmic heavy metal sensor [candidate division KSB1 bacterium]MDH7560970.1 periplasmic heavy metal sensor [bacterium]